jgi:cytochrome c-type biogenesis protein CcmF
MTVELGHFALVLALTIALLQGTLPLRGAARGDVRAMAVAPAAAVVQAVLVAVSFGCLVAAYVVSDFSVLNVALNSHSSKPLIYKVAGAWGNHEGSMLLWVLILALFGGAVAVFGGNLPLGLKARALAVQAWIAGCCRRPLTARASTRCCRTRVSRCTRRSSTSAMSASRWPSPSPSPP